MTIYNKEFLKKYQKARDEKNSVLCAGFDPALPGQREKNTMAKRFVDETASAEEAILAFFEEFLESVKDHCCAIKPNNQYIFHMGLDAYKKMNRMIHKEGLVSILDQKIGDIGSSNDAGFYWMQKMGFDAVTHSPFAGNIAGSIERAHLAGLGVITLTLMSNPDATYFMKDGIIGGEKGYAFIAAKLQEFGGDGMVVGATGHVTAEDIKTIRARAGKEVVMLVPGIGKQQGDLRKVLVHGGENVLLNVGRAIMYADSIEEAAKTYNERFNTVRKELG